MKKNFSFFWGDLGVFFSHFTLMEGEKNPKKKRNIFYCESCDYSTSLKFSFDRHILTQKHILQINGEKKPKKKEKTFYCAGCDFITNNKKDFERHSSTRKHLELEKPQKKGQTEDEPVDDLTLDENFEKTLEPISEPNITTVIMELMKRQDFLQNTLVELAKNQSIANSTVNTNSNNINNTTNQQFNLQFFLNETCKDAMNIDDFVKTLKVGIEDFETTGKLGYVEGITRIIMNGLRQVDTTKRPIHCTDIKRETVYIKNQDAWEKENQEKEKLKNAVNQVARMNLSQLPKWQQENPSSEILDTTEHDKYMKYSMAALGGLGEKEEDRYIDKIMKNVMKEVAVDKATYISTATKR
jgi:hypothetical protein